MAYFIRDIKHINESLFESMFKDAFIKKTINESEDKVYLSKNNILSHILKHGIQVNAPLVSNKIPPFKHQKYITYPFAPIMGWANTEPLVAATRTQKGVINRALDIEKIKNAFYKAESSSDGNCILPTDIIVNPKGYSSGNTYRTLRKDYKSSNKYQFVDSLAFQQVLDIHEGSVIISDNIVSNEVYGKFDRKSDKAFKLVPFNMTAFCHIHNLSSASKENIKNYIKGEFLDLYKSWASKNGVVDDAEDIKVNKNEHYKNFSEFGEEVKQLAREGKIKLYKGNEQMNRLSIAEYYSKIDTETFFSDYIMKYTIPVTQGHAFVAVPTSTNERVQLVDTLTGRNTEVNESTRSGGNKFIENVSGDKLGDIFMNACNDIAAKFGTKILTYIARNDTIKSRVSPESALSTNNDVVSGNGYRRWFIELDSTRGKIDLNYEGFFDLDETNGENKILNHSAPKSFTAYNIVGNIYPFPVDKEIDSVEYNVKDGVSSVLEKYKNKYGEPNSDESIGFNIIFVKKSKGNNAFIFDGYDTQFALDHFETTGEISDEMRQGIHGIAEELISIPSSVFSYGGASGNNKLIDYNKINKEGHYGSDNVYVDNDSEIAKQALKDNGF